MSMPRKGLLQVSERLLRQRAAHLAGVAEQLDTHAVDNEQLKLQIAELRRVRFGRKSG